MLNKELVELINFQINRELYSSYLYLSISSFYKKNKLNGFSSWFKKQANEELEHASKFISYLEDEGEEVIYSSIEAFKEQFNNLKEPLVFTLHHEEYVTSLINKLYSKAIEIKDYKTQLFLNWFIEEQMEEERSSQELIDNYELYVEGSETKALHHLDEKLGERK